MKHRWRHLLLVLTATATGCLGLKPARDTTRYLVLSPPPPAPPSPASAERPGLALGLAPVVLPHYLDTPRMAVRLGGNEIRYFETYRWGERLDQGVRRVLAAHLAVQLAPTSVAVYAWRPSDVRWELNVELEHCEVSVLGRAQVAGGWRLTRPLSAEVVGQGHHRVEVDGPPPETDPAGAAAALSRALATFADAMAESLAWAGE